MHRAFLRVVTFCVLLSTLGGCGAINEFLDSTRFPLLSREGKRLPEPRVPRVYPVKAEVGGQLDIEVLRSGKGIVLENRTVRSYENVELWLNQEFGGPLEEIELGRNDRLALLSFTNRYAERYPTARFLQPDADRPLVLAELLIDGKVYKLPVRLTDDWRRP